MLRPSITPRNATAHLLLLSVLVLGLLASGCATTGKRGSSLLPTQYKVSTGPFVIHSNDPIAVDSPALRALDGLKDDLGARLDCRENASARPIQVYVLDDRGAFLHLLRFYFPELPPRRAFFLAEGDQRVVYTYQGPKLEEDLRHEATHALLRGRFGDIPLWLDEGLAEYFEAGPDVAADRKARLDRLADDRRGGWTPNLSRLESMTDIHQMSPRDYRESWAWVDLLLGEPRSGAAIVIDHLEQGRNRAEPLSKTLDARGADARALLARLESGAPPSIAQKPVALESGREAIIRLQDRSPDPPPSKPAPPARGGLFRRLADFLGL